MYSRSVSFHPLYHRFHTHHISNILHQIKKQLPYVKPCYAVTNASSSSTLNFLREKQIDMVYMDKSPIVISNNLAIGGMRPNEYIVRSVADIHALVSATGSGSGSGSRPAPAVPMFWIKTAISNDRIEQTREMFEYIWANKYILNGIVFDIHNFSNGYIPPTMYSYKIATEYVFRNMVLPFEREYGIKTPAIMIDGVDHITQIRHLAELHSHALNETTVINAFLEKKTEVRLILGRLFDLSQPGVRDTMAFHEYP